LAEAGRPGPGQAGPSAARVATTAAVVLAAGSSRRLGGRANKLLVPFRGRPLVAWAVESALGAGLDETVVVEGAVSLEEVVGEGVTLLRNESWADGQGSSLGVALDWCARQGHQAAVVGLGDQPMVPSQAWRQVASATSAPIAVATYAGRRRNPVRLDASVWPLVDTGADQGARELMLRRPELVVEVACEGEPADLDTWEDFERWS
jgi:CTP:molybdopterin cytidylyltransferase MocA